MDNIKILFDEAMKKIDNKPFDQKEKIWWEYWSTANKGEEKFEIFWEESHGRKL